MKIVAAIAGALLLIGVVVLLTLTLSSDTELTQAERDKAAYTAALHCYVETDQEDSVDAFNECYKSELRRIQALFLQQKQG